jgi:hypothetical protein
MDKQGKNSCERSLNVGVFSKVAIIGLCAGAFLMLQAQTFIRANLAGYFPSAEKRIVVMSSEDLSARAWTITNDLGSVEKQGTVGASAVGVGDHSAFAYNYEVLFSDLAKEGNFVFSIDGVEGARSFKITSDPYSEAIASSLRWIRVQRSGSVHVLDREPAHFGDSVSFVYYRTGPERTDPWEENDDFIAHNLLGGWYASTDYSKSTPLIALTTFYLLRAYNLAPETFTRRYSPSNLIDILDEARFGLEYLLKVMPNDKDFIINVGGYDSEHGVRLPHRDRRDGLRPAYSIPSSSCMASVAAALAVGASTFRNIDADFAQKCRDMAIRMFNRALDPDIRPEWLERGWALFPDPTAEDNLLMAAVALHELTGEEHFLTRAKTLSDNLPAAYWVSWDIQNILAQTMVLPKHPSAQRTIDESLGSFFGNSRNTENIWNLPKGYTINALYNYFVIGIGAGAYSVAAGNKNYANIVLDVLNYNYGINNWGVSFTALQSIPESVSRFNHPIYRLQQRFFPEGVTAIGPTDRATHAAQSIWILYDLRTTTSFPFNTEAVVFYDLDGDFISMGGRTSGAAKNIYLMTLANKLFGRN